MPSINCKYNNGDLKNILFYLLTSHKHVITLLKTGLEMKNGSPILRRGGVRELLVELRGRVCDAKVMDYLGST